MASPETSRRRGARSWRRSVARTLSSPVRVGCTQGMEGITARAVPGPARAGREKNEALFRSNGGTEIEANGHFTCNPLPEILLRVIGPHVRKVLTVVAAPDDDPPGLRVIHGEMTRSCRRSLGGLRLFPDAASKVVEPGVGQVVTLTIAAEEHQDLLSR